MSDIHHQLDWRQRSWLSSGWRGFPGRLELHGARRLHRFSGAALVWERILEDIEVLSADHVILTGDLTAMGDEAEFEAVHASVGHLLRDGRLTVIPGNHDRYTDSSTRVRFETRFAAQLASAMPEYADAKGYPFVRLVGDDVAFIGLDSTRVRGWGQYFLGRLGPEQLAALTRILDDPRLAGRTIHVLSHHGPLSPAGRREWVESALIDGPQLLHALAGRKVMLHHGHSHTRSWHDAKDDRPHLFGGGSSTEVGREGYWVLDVDGHSSFEVQHLQPGRGIVSE